MTETTCKIGNKYSWPELPDGALVLWSVSGEHYIKLDYRLAARVSTQGVAWFDGRIAPIVNFDDPPEGPQFTTIALGLSGQENAKVLRQLAGLAA